MQDFIILAIICTLKLIVTEVDRRTEIRTPILHPAISRCDKKWRVKLAVQSQCAQSERQQVSAFQNRAINLQSGILNTG